MYRVSDEFGSRHLFAFLGVLGESEISCGLALIKGSKILATSRTCQFFRHFRSVTVLEEVQQGTGAATEGTSGGVVLSSILFEIFNIAVVFGTGRVRGYRGP
jgi:hypothetical protein